MPRLHREKSFFIQMSILFLPGRVIKVSAQNRKGIEMKTLVVGASGATGRLLVEQLLDRGQHVKIIVRSTENLPDKVTNHDNLSVIQASVLDLSDSEMAQHVSGCNALASCLGHNLNFKGMFGPPRRLVTDATRRLCNARQGKQAKKTS